MVNDVEVYVHSEQWDVVVSFERVEQLLRNMERQVVDK